MFTVWQKCDRCKKWRACESVTGVCEPCYDGLSAEIAAIPTTALTDAQWRDITRGLKEMRKATHTAGCRITVRRLP